MTKGVGSFDQYGLSFLAKYGAQFNLYSGSANDALLTPTTGPNVFESVPITITETAPSPEPSSFALLGTGLLGLGLLAKRQLA